MEKSQSTLSMNSSRHERTSLNNSSSRTNVYVPKPKLCKVCKRGSFLKCFDCDVIYCSAKCQIKDWEDHQFQHAQKRCEQYTSPQGPRLARATGLGRESLQNRLNAVRSEPFKPECGKKVDGVNTKCSSAHREVAQSSGNRNKSVQDRLKVIESEPVKQITAEPDANNNSMDIDDVCNSISSVTLQNTPHPMASQESIVDQSLRKMITVRKFKRHVQLDPEMQESDGYYYVAVLAEDIHPDKTLVYWVTPFEQKARLEEYREELDAYYSSSKVDTISWEDVPKFKSHLVMAKIGGCWSRAQILNIDEKSGVISVECIDTGEKAILVYAKNPLKVACEPEMLKSAYGIKLTFENITEPGTVEPTDILKICITQAVPHGVNIAKVQMQTQEVNMDETEVVSVKSEIALRRTIDHLEVKEIHQGEVKLLYCDGSKIDEGKLHVSESLKENWTLYDQLADEISAYINANKSSGGYKPVIRELILARFSDGFFYRAVCVNASEVDVKVHFIDYGSDYVVDIKYVYQLPESLMHSCVSHTVDFQLASGGSLKGINGAETREKLLEKNEFKATVKKVSDNPRKYLITLDDSLVVF